MFSSSVHDKIQRLGAEEEPPMTLANEGTNGRPLTNEDVASKPRWITRGDIKLHEHFGFSHEGPWLHINEKVCEKVKLYDFK